MKTKECSDWPGQLYTLIPVEKGNIATTFSLCLQQYHQNFGRLYCLYGQAKVVKMTRVKDAAELGLESHKKFWWSYTGFFYEIFTFFGLN